MTILELATDLDLPKHGQLWHQLRQTGPDPQLTKHLSQDLRQVVQLMMGNDHERRFVSIFIIFFIIGVETW